MDQSSRTPLFGNAKHWDAEEMRVFNNGVADGLSDEQIQAALTSRMGGRRIYTKKSIASQRSRHKKRLERLNTAQQQGRTAKTKPASHHWKAAEEKLLQEEVNKVIGQGKSPKYEIIAATMNAAFPGYPNHVFYPSMLQHKMRELRQKERIKEPDSENWAENLQSRLPNDTDEGPHEDFGGIPDEFYQTFNEFFDFGGPDETGGSAAIWNTSTPEDHDSNMHSTTQGQNTGRDVGSGVSTQRGNLGVGGATGGYVQRNTGGNLLDFSPDETLADFSMFGVLVRK
ncbi:hypothetical protein HYFRA_00008995 [Hymenoscyphus fraxineus]|uniref:Uncharacterized protein n=1 Tax=Hymenoscyphus fraxineus TaxID=746836 RepID=A0A9N9KSI5_9HELO|nr:hypothetical protein HYFRA_00008995 [Hymenoscyphus fraxineus]